MAFDSLAEFFAMGGHALYVWLAYGATYLVLIALFAHSVSAHNKQRGALRALRRRAAADQEAQ